MRPGRAVLHEDALDQLRWIDLAVLVIYLLGVTGLGCAFARRSRSTEGFMAARRAVPGWAVGLSIFGTYVSSISFLALPSKAFDRDWGFFAFSLSLPIAAWVAVRWFVPFFRRAGEVSAYHHLEHRFGPWARTYAAFCYLLTQVARMGTISYLVALATSPLVGWSVPSIILVTGGLVVVYTLLGGIEAVIWTDVVQSIILIGGALACAAAILLGMPEGPGQTFRIAAEHGKFGLGSFALALDEPTFWVVLVYGLAINLQNFGIDQNYVQRYIVARSDREAARSVWLGALLYVPISATFFFIGAALFAYYHAQPELLPPSLDAAKSPDRVFPQFIVSRLPPGMVGLVIAAIFAAAQSTLSTSLNGSATLLLRDVYQRYLRPQAGERESMAVLYGATLLVGLLGTGVALAMTRVRSAIDAWWSLAGIFSGGMLGLFLLGFLSRRAGSRAAAVGVATGVLAILWMTLSLSPRWPEALRAWRSPLHEFLVPVVGTLAILAVGLWSAAIHRRFSRPRRG